MFSINTWIQRKSLTKQTHSVEVEERRAAIEELGEVGNAGDIQVVVAALKDPESSVRKAAARALLLLDDPKAVEPLIEALLDPNRRGGWQREIVAALEHFRDPRAVKACIEALTSPSVGVRRAAADALGTLGDASAVKPLLKTISDENAEVSHEAAYALTKIGSASLPGLIEILDHGTVPAKISAVEALGILGERKAIPLMVAALQQSDSYLQIASAKALARIHDPSVVKPLIMALEESSNAAFFYGVSDEASTSLLKMGNEVVGPLLESLPKASPRGRLFIIRLLAELPDPRNFEPLVEMLQDPDLEVRKAAFNVLLKTDRQRLAEYLPPLLDESDPHLRRRIGEALFLANWQPDNPRDEARFNLALGRPSGQAT